MQVEIGERLPHSHDGGAKLMLAAPPAQLARRPVRRGLIGLNLWLTAALLLMLAVAVLWEDWLQFHPWAGAVMALAASACAITLSGRRPPVEQRFEKSSGDDDEMLRGAYRVTLQRKHDVRRWD